MRTCDCRWLSTRADEIEAEQVREQHAGALDFSPIEQRRDGAESHRRLAQELEQVHCVRVPEETRKRVAPLAGAAQTEQLKCNACDQACQTAE